MRIGFLNLYDYPPADGFMVLLWSIPISYLFFGRIPLSSLLSQWNKEKYIFERC